MLAAVWMRTSRRFPCRCFSLIRGGLVNDDSQKEFYSALWGKFAAEILMQNWDTALEDLNRLRELLQSKVRVGNAGARVLCGRN